MKRQIYTILQCYNKCNIVYFETACISMELQTPTSAMYKIKYFVIMRPTQAQGQAHNVHYTL